MFNKTNNSDLKCIILVTFLVIQILNNVGGVDAANYTFLGTIDADFNEAGNWDLNQIPSFFDSVFFINQDAYIYFEDVMVTNVTITNCFLSNYVYLSASNHISIEDIHSWFLMHDDAITVAKTIENKGYISMSGAFIMYSKIRNHKFIRAGIEKKNTTIYFTETEFTLEEGSVLISFNGSTIYLSNSKTTANNGLIQALDYSTFLVQQGTFDAYGESTFHIETSRLYLNDSQIYLYDNSVIFNTDTATTFLIGQLKTYNTSSIVLQDKSKLLIQGDLELNDYSFITSLNSTVILSGNLSNRFSSNVAISDHSEFYVFGYAHFEPQSTFNSTFSSVLITGALNMNGNYYDHYSSIFVDGIFDFNKYGHFDNSEIIVDGKMNVIGHLEGNNTFIGVLGNLVAQKDSIIDCTGCVIVVMNGNFYVSSAAQLKLINSSFVNSNGSYIAMGDTFIQEGSTFVNKASMTLDSNVFQTDNTTLSDKVFIDNHGDLTMNGANKQSINVPIVNNGTIKTSNNEIFMYKYTQTNGSFILNGGSVSSSDPIDIIGGNMNGNGTINGGISNKGSVGSNQVNQFSINGVYSQGSNGSLTMTINSLDSFSQLNISSEANLGGTLIIRINQDLLNQATDQNENTTINILNFEKQSGSFSNIQFKYFNPTTQQDVPEPTTKNECQEIKSGSSSRSFSVLISNNCNDVIVGGGSKKLAKGAIAGIVVSCVVAAALVGVILHYRERLSRFLFLKKQNVSNRMRSLSGRAQKN
ncbi:hypothetical protein CYY_008936 [Polysphondylium violaceum]|uniref:Transmembrane protein n=1 Tax=Polysphondylium violaceum TaxID=133409 RepID=A0A8J4PKU7_9MYCE|nr:hypothetical protein CYY_008936 [Polysphondylium violaceum]